jgi:ADP-heptose:LPS heptosyltransferase
MTIEPPARIAVLRANGLGDFLFAMPAIAALRQTFLQAEVVLLGLAWHEEFLAGRPGPIDRVVVVPPARGVGMPEDFVEEPAVLEAFFRRMADGRFDLAVQLHGGGQHSNPFVRRLGAKWTIGLRSPVAAELDAWVPYVYYQPEVLRYLEVVALAGARTADLEPRVELTAADREEAARALALSNTPLAILHPGAGDPRRRWPAEKFAAVGDALSAAGVQVAVTGSSEERPITQAVIQAMRAEAVDLAGRVSLGGLAGLLARAAVVVANDTGPLHLAAAVGTSTVGIFWCGNLINAGPMTRTRHRPAIAWRLACPECGRDTTREGCEHRGSFVADVSVDEVIESTRGLLGDALTNLTTPP